MTSINELRIQPRKTIYKVRRMDMEVEYTLQVSQGKFSLPHLSLIVVDDEYPILVQHKASMYPASSDLGGKASGMSDKWIWQLLSEEAYELIEDTFRSWRDNKKEGMNPYTYMYAHLKGKGYDLHRDFHVM